jgi:hypothetical protein
MLDITRSAVIRGALGAALALAAALPAVAFPASSPARAPTRLWYFLHVDYKGELHRDWRFYGGDAPPTAYTVNELHDEVVDWTAHSRGPVLVRLGPHGGFSILNGMLAGHVFKADVDDVNTEDLDFLRCRGTGPC